MFSKKNNKEISNVTVSKCTLLTPPNFAKRFFSTSPGYYGHPKRKQKQSYARFFGGGGGGILGPAIIKQKK